MKNLFNSISIFSLLLLFSLRIFAQEKESDWKLGIQSYTFHHFTLTESIVKASHAEIKYMEAFHGQNLGNGFEGKMFTADKTTREKLLDFAKSKNVKIISAGVFTRRSLEEWEQIFKASSEMGIEIITCEPEYEDLKFIDQLANQYNIDVAIHNHPKPSDYWNPDLFLENVKGLSERIGGCADIGHWKRMGVDPVEGLKKYGNRLKVIHLKDIEAKQEGKDYQDDVVLGKGIVEIETIFKELKTQNFKGLFAIEFEGDQQKLMANVHEYVQFFNNSVSDLFKNRK